VPWRDAATDLEARWRRLEADANGSFFLCWSFIGPYAACFEKRAAFHLFEWIEDGETLALALLDFGTVRRRKLFAVRAVALNRAFDPAADMCIEYNGVLARRGREREAEGRLLEALQSPGTPRWDELQLANLSNQGFETRGLKRVDDDAFNGSVADLSPDCTRDTFLQRLSSNRRSQLRRSIKACEAAGPLAVHEAADIDTALDWFARLGELHNARWRRDGIQGAFENPDWVRFHEGVIQRALPIGGIQLLRITTGPDDVGYLYNFRWRGVIAMVQSGFAESANNAHRPGMVCHLLAMEHNAMQGATAYDFLGGDADYKRVLGTRATSQVNVRLQRRGVMTLWIEEALVHGVRYCRQSWPAGR
jgi:CelD/BcsL family acetyltransferase involved in cellulose biosynthesis